MRKCGISNPPGIENCKIPTHLHMTGHCEGIPWVLVEGWDRIREEESILIFLKAE